MLKENYIKYSLVFCVRIIKDRYDETFILMQAMIKKLFFKLVIKKIISEKIPKEIK